MLYLLSPTCIIAALGTVLSMKYEVDEKYWRIDSDDVLSPEQKEIKLIALDDRALELKIQGYTFIFLSFATFIIATYLLLIPKKICS